MHSLPFQIVPLSNLHHLDLTTSYSPYSESTNQHSKVLLLNHDQIPIHSFKCLEF